MNPHTLRCKTHDYWLSGIAIVLGFLWFVSGMNKVLHPDFYEQFAIFAQDEFLAETAYQWYRTFFEGIILPNAVFVAQLVTWGELAIGIGLILGSILLFISDRPLYHYLVALAGVGSFVIVFNLLCASGALIPKINPDMAFFEGVNLDMVVLLLSVVLISANINEACKECIDGTSKKE